MREWGKDMGGGLKQALLPPVKIEPPPKAPEPIANPVKELAEKLTNKTLISQNDIHILTQVLEKEFLSNTDKLLAEGEKPQELARDFLWLCYYAIVNAHPYSQSPSYLVRETLNNFVGEILTYIQKATRLLTKSDLTLQQLQATLCNSIIPVSLLILSLFTGDSREKKKSAETVYLQNHYKYLRLNNFKRLDTISLQTLNQVFTQFKKAASKGGPTQQQVNKPTDIIQITSGKSADQLLDKDAEFMTSLLEFTPTEYAEVVKQIAAQIAERKDKSDIDQYDEVMSSVDEESKQDDASKSVFEVSNSIIEKTKLIESLSQAIDMMVSQCTGDKALDYYLYIDCDLVRSIMKYTLIIPTLKSAKFDNFIAETVIKLAIEAQRNIINCIQPAERMETDKPGNVLTMQQINEVQQQAQLLAKSCEIMSLQQAHFHQNMESLLASSGCFTYLGKLERKVLGAHTYVSTIAHACQRYLGSKSNSFKFPSLSSTQRLDYLTIETMLLVVAKRLSDRSWKDQMDRGPLFSEVQLPKNEDNSSEPPKDGRGVQTRNQAKQDQQQKPTAANKKGRGKAGAVKAELPKPVFVQIDCDDLLKEALSHTAQFMHSYFSTGKCQISAQLIKNLTAINKQIASAPIHIGRLMQGILSHFTRAKFDPEAHALLRQSVLAKQEYSSHARVAFNLKLTCLLQQSEGETIASDILTQLIESSWNEALKNQVEHLNLKSNATFNKYISVITCLMLLHQYGCKQQLETLVKQASSSDKPSQLILTQVTLMSKASLGKFKPILHKYMTQAFKEEKDLQALATECENMTNSLFNQAEPTYEKALLQITSEKFNQENIIAKLKASHQVRGIGVSLLEYRQKIQQALQATAKLSRELGVSDEGSEEIRHLDLESYIAVQMSLGCTSSELTNSKFEGNSTSIMQGIITKAKLKQELRGENLEFVSNQIRSIRYLNDNFLQPIRVAKLTELLQSKNEAIAKAILESTAGWTQTNKKLTTQIQSLCPSKNSLEGEFLSLLIDATYLAKHVANHKSSGQNPQDLLFSHVFSVNSVENQALIPPANEFQAFTSSLILMKQLFNNLYQFCTAQASLENFKDEKVRTLVLEGVRTLMRLKQQNSYLELNDGGSFSFDFALNEALYFKALGGSTQQLTNKDILKYRSFNNALNILNNMEKLTLQEYEPLSSLATEVVNEGLSEINVKMNNEHKLLMAYFQMDGSESQLAATFSKTIEQCCTAETLWELFMNYAKKPFRSTDQTQAQVSRENKGGISLDIQFNEGMGNKKKRVNFGKQQDETMASQDNNNDSGSLTSLNPIALRILSLILDMLSAEKVSSDDYKRLSANMRRAFLSISDEFTAPLFLTLSSNLQQCKKLIHTLLQENVQLLGGQELKKELQKKLLRCVVYMIQHLKGQVNQSGEAGQEHKQTLLLSIELAIIVSDSNKQMIELIAREILQGASNLLGGASESILRVTILDLLCQLAQNRYSESVDGKVKYSLKEIKERRKQLQEARKRREANLKRLQNMNNDELADGQQPTRVQQVEGFKEDKLNQVDIYQTFMHKPSDVCTFTISQKDFQEQHWYWCYTCKLVDNSGCCAVCVNRCHAGHHVVYSKQSNFFCDCGNSPNCKSLKLPPAAAQNKEQPKPNPSNNENTMKNAFQDHLKRRQERMELEKDSPPKMRDMMMLFSQQFGERRPRDPLPIDPLPIPQPNFMQPPMGSLFMRPPQQHHFGAHLIQPPPIDPMMNIPMPMSNPLMDPIRLQEELIAPGLHHAERMMLNAMANDQADEEIIQYQILEQQQFNARYIPDQINSGSDNGSNSEDDDPSQPSEVRRILRHIKKINRQGPGREQMPLPYEPLQARDGEMRRAYRGGYGLPMQRGDRFPQPEYRRGGRPGSRDQHNHNGHPFGGYGGRGSYRGEHNGVPPDRNNMELHHTESVVSEINPLEDPFSEASQIPIKEGDFINFSQLSSQKTEDQDMVEYFDLTQQESDLIDALKTHQSLFDEVFQTLLILVEAKESNIPLEVSISNGVNQLNFSDSGPSPIIPQDDLKQHLCDGKKSQKLVSDLTINKKIFRNDTIKQHFMGMPNKEQNALRQSINLMNTIDSNKDGLVAVCEGSEVAFFAGSQFFEDEFQQIQQQNEHYNYVYGGPSDSNLIKLESQKLSYMPLAVKFNPYQPQYVAVVGTQHVDVISLNSQGKITQFTNLNLQLEAMGLDLSIVNVNWVPNSQSLIAIATRTFINIYDLAVDNISPSYAFQVFNGNVTDFTFSAPHSISNSKAETTLYVATNQGGIYHHSIQYTQDSFNLEEENDGEDAEMKEERGKHENWCTLNEVVNVSRALKSQNDQIRSIHCCRQLQNLFIISAYYGYNNQSYNIVGRINESTHQLESYFILTPDASNRGSNLMNTWERYGQSLSCMRDLGVHGDKALILAIGRDSLKDQQGHPLLIQISKDQADINLISQNNIMGGNRFMPTVGLAYVNKSTQGSTLKRLVNVMIDGSLSISQIAHTQAQDEIEKAGLLKNNSMRLPELNLDKLISRSDLPREFKPSINFFEKPKSLVSDQGLRQMLTLGGDIVNYYKNSKTTIDKLSIFNGQYQIQENGKKVIRLQMKLDNNSEMIIVGFRLRMDFSQSKDKNLAITVKMFNRQVKMTNYNANGNANPLWFDLPFCDAEALFGSANMNNATFDLTTDDPKNCPFRICAMDVYGLTKKEFDFKGKLKILEKAAMEREKKQNQVQPGLTEAQKNDLLVKAELLQSKQLPLASYKEKISHMRGHLSKEQVHMIMTLDVITQYLSLTKSYDQASFDQLFPKLQNLLFKSYSSKEESQQYVTAAIKRCLKKLLQVLYPDAPLGDSRNYQTIKDKLLQNAISVRLPLADLSMDELRKYLRRISMIHDQRYYQLLKFLEAQPQMCETIISQYLKLFKLSADSSECNLDIRDIITIVVAEFQRWVNDSKLVKSASTIPEAIQMSFQDESLSQAFNLLLPLLQSENDIIQKVTISALLNIIQLHADKMGSILKQNKLPSLIYSFEMKRQAENLGASISGPESRTVELLIVDISPQLLRYAFKLLNEGTGLGGGQSHNIAYQLIFKCAKKIEQNCEKLYNGLFIESLTSQIEKFLKGVFSEKTTQQSQLYSNLILANAFLHQSISEANAIKVKQTQVSLNETSRKLIIKNLDKDKEFIRNYCTWVNQLLNKYRKLFESQKGSVITKYEEGIPTGNTLVEFRQAQGRARNLLQKPIQQVSQWKWHPLFTKCDFQFEYLDRKIPVQLLLNLVFMGQQLNNLHEVDQATNSVTQLLQSVQMLAFKNPGKEILSEVGDLTCRILLKALNQSGTDIDKIVQVQYKDSVSYQEFFDLFEILFCKKIATQQGLSFNLQFLLHNLLSNMWKSVSQSADSWQHFILALPQKHLQLIYYLSQSIFLLNDDIAQLCLQICALAFDKTIITSFKYPEGIALSLFQVLGQSGKLTAEGVVSGVALGDIDVGKIIDVMLVGRNKKQLRISAAHFLKGIFDVSSDMRERIKSALIERLPQLRTKGVNSNELIALLSYIINQLIEINGISSDAELFKRLTREIFKQIEKTNSQLTGHENLEVYAALQRMTSAFTTQHELNLSHPSEENEKKIDIILSMKERSSKANNKIINPYLLESEACQKCYAQKSLPFTQIRLADVKTEQKFTDANVIYRLNTAYQIKSLTFNQDNFRGNKVVKEIHVYINNKQSIDLADMKNNWAHWQKVKSHELESLGQRQTTIDFTIPVTATNILIQFVTCNTNKPLQQNNGGNRGGGSAPKKHPKGGQKVKSTVQNINEVQGIDCVIMTLPKFVAANLGVVSNSGESESSGIDVDEQLQCHRCGRQAQGKNGMCNSCGENALQCQFCRNINYEKPDGFLCNECGNSRFVKLDISAIMKQDFASDKIETEDAKTQAANQIEHHLQQAQQAFSKLMGKRNQISGLMKKINEGSTETAKIMADMYSDECSELYSQMMRSLNIIKSLKIEIENYNSTGISKVDQSKPESFKNQLSLQKARSCISSAEDELVNESCFSCIQEYLKSLLNFVRYTADNLGSEYQAQGFLNLLYTQNMKMYSAQLQAPARKAICSLVKKAEERGISLLKRVQADLFNKKNAIPAHLLAQNLTQETQIVLELLSTQIVLRGKDSNGHNYYPSILNFFWVILCNSLKEGSTVAPIAELVASSFINFINEAQKQQTNSSAIEIQEIQYALFDEKDKQKAHPQLQGLLKAQDEYLDGQTYLMYGLTLGSSQRVRLESKLIISNVITNRPQFSNCILRSLLATLDRVLLLDSSAGDQYFELLEQVLSPQIIKEKVSEVSLKKGSETHIFVEAFDKLFKTIESELGKLLMQENSRASLGADGFMPQISTGQIFHKIVSLVSLMIKESVHLKGIIQRNVNIVIKSFLKIRKLNLTKNKLISQSEVEIEKMFKELHSSKDEEKEHFILECLKLIESGDCDFQEMRFLFEEMCKIIDPVKPEPDYLLHLDRARTQDEFFRRKMGKNPYTSSQLGKTMADVRVKICKEVDMAEPELVELLVQNKLVGMDLTIRQVYEQVHWPAYCRAKNPDLYDIPPIEEALKRDLQPMHVIYRLMGIDGEAQEDRVDSLQDSSEADLDPANILKKFGITQVYAKPFSSKSSPSTSVNGIQVLIGVMDNFGSLQQNRYLAEWLFKLIGYTLKIKSVRLQFMEHKETVDNLAKRLLESIGLQSQIESQKGMTLFDVILGILDTIIVELNQQQEGEAAKSQAVEQSSLKMEIDQRQENTEASTHVELFIKILSDSCSEMLEKNQGLDQVSKKIKAVSKILPFLINQEDVSAQNIIIKFIRDSSVKIHLLDNLAEMTANEKFSAQFFLDRAIEIIESITTSKTYIKDAILKNCGSLLETMWNYLLSTTLANTHSQQQIMRYKLANMYTLKLLLVLTKNHPATQESIFSQHKQVIDKIYELSEAKLDVLTLKVLANDILQSLNNKNQVNFGELSDYIQTLVDKKKNDQKSLAALKREQIMKQMQEKKAGNKFLKQLDNAALQEETGPKCIVCHEGYIKKPSEVLGMYVFSKRLQARETQPGSRGHQNVQAYTTVTHAHFIHFTCHQNAARADSQMKQAKKEWDGATIRNAHTKCNNLFPLRGGNLSHDSYGQMVERYFQVLQGSISNCDNDRVKVLVHDCKQLMKRLAYEDSFSRDTHGGGPEHNMHLVPLFGQMIQYILSQGRGYPGNSFVSDGSQGFIYQQEQRISEFLEQGMKLKQSFLKKLEEEKKHEDEVEEEFKQAPDGGQEEGESSQMSNLSLDQIALMLTKSLFFCQLPQWETSYKQQFFSIILCTVAGMKDEKLEDMAKAQGGQSDFNTGKRVLSINKAQFEDAVMISDEATTTLGAQSEWQQIESKRRRLSSDIKGSDQLNKLLIRIRPLLVLLRLVDQFKQRWDGMKLRLQTQGNSLKCDVYLKRLVEEFLAKGNLKESMDECDEIFRDYKERSLRTSSVEEYLEDLNLIQAIQQSMGEQGKAFSNSQCVEQYILSHFQA